MHVRKSSTPPQPVHTSRAREWRQCSSGLRNCEYPLTRRHIPHPIANCRNHDSNRGCARLGVEALQMPSGRCRPVGTKRRRQTRARKTSTGKNMHWRSAGDARAPQNPSSEACKRDFRCGQQWRRGERARERGGRGRGCRLNTRPWCDCRCDSGWAQGRWGRAPLAHRRRRRRLLKQASTQACKPSFAADVAA